MQKSKKEIKAVLEASNYQTNSAKRYETGIRDILIKEGFTVLRLDYEQGLPDYLVVSPNMVATFLEIKNFRTAKSAAEAKQRVLMAEGKKRGKEREHLLEQHDILYCVAWGGEKTIVYK